MKLEMVPVDTIKPSPRNPRVIPQKAVRAVAESIEAFGFLVPVVLDENGELLAGHTRLKAALLLKQSQVPAVRKVGLTAAEKDKFRLADNKLAEMTSWDEPQLLAILKSFDDELPPGFGDDDLADLEALLAEDDDTEDPGDGAGSGSGTDTEGAPGLVPIVVRCRRDVAVEAKRRCEEVVKELESR